MVMPSINFIGLRSKISHFNLRRALKASISFGDEAVVKMSSI